VSLIFVIDPPKAVVGVKTLGKGEVVLTITDERAFWEEF
jgi:hypothetical protein